MIHKLFQWHGIIVATSRGYSLYPLLVQRECKLNKNILQFHKSRANNQTIIYDFANIHLNTYRIDEMKADIYLSLS